jgi:two-component system, OmpR family, alkaline phosphatase synthesis response regulator PhoP
MSANMSTGESDRERPVVLIADNEPDIVELVRFELEREGYDVIRALNGQQAFDLACEHQPDLVLVDVHMPKLDGYEVTRKIRADERLRPVPVMILSGSVLESDVEQSFEAGANRHMGKPFSPVALRTEVGALLKK